MRKSGSGAVLGAAIGDAMGAPTEFLSMEQIRARFGPDGVTGFAWGPWGPGSYTDDTQMAEIVLRTMLDGYERGLSVDATMRHLADEFVGWSLNPRGGHRAPGSACLAGCRALVDGVAWDRAGADDAGGCGSVMRVYPAGLVYAADSRMVLHMAVCQSRLTHSAPSALAACAAMAHGVAMCVRSVEPVDPLELISEMIARASVFDAETSVMMRSAYSDAIRGVQPEETLDILRGWSAKEAVAAAVYVFTRHSNDVRAAILEGANTPGDSDSIATLVGALVGARLGLEAIPSEWVRDVERSSELLELGAITDLLIEGQR